MSANEKKDPKKVFEVQNHGPRSSSRLKLVYDEEGLRALLDVIGPNEKNHFHVELTAGLFLGLW